MKVHPAFHVSLLKSAIKSPLSTPAKPSPPPRLIEGYPAFAVHRLLDVYRWG